MTDYCFTGYLTTSFFAITEEDKQFFQEVANTQRLDFNSKLIVWYDDTLDAIYFKGHIDDIMSEKYYGMICECIINR